MDYSNSNGQQSSTEGENKSSSVFGGMWDGLKSGFSGLKNKVTGMVSSSSTSAEENPTHTGGKGRKHKKSMKGGKGRKHRSSKARKGKGKKRTYGRK